MKDNQRSSYNKAHGICIEIGTWDGGFTEAILSKPNVLKVYCVDPYKHFINNEYPDGMNELTQQEFDKKYNNTKNKLSIYGERVEFIRQTSLDASKMFEDNTLDFVYIDGNHDYKYVLQDLTVWYPKLKSGGFLCGDDLYSTNLDEHDSDGNVLKIWSQNCWGKYGTYKAIVDFGKPFKIEDNQFCIIKN